MAAVLPLPGVKPVCRMGQHYFCREGSPEGGLVVVGRLSLSKGTVLGPKLLCDAVSSRGLKRLAAWPARAVLVDWSRRRWPSTAAAAAAAAGEGTYLTQRKHRAPG